MVCPLVVVVARSCPADSEVTGGPQGSLPAVLAGSFLLGNSPPLPGKGLATSAGPQAAHCLLSGRQWQ